MGDFALIPAAPVLLAGIDHLETEHTVGLRSAIEALLSSRPDWALPVADLPPLAGLGGWGIDRGIDTRSGRFLADSAWTQAVAALSEAERRASAAADPAIIVALLHAHAAGVEVGPLDSSANLLLPVDLSAASGDDAPLAPVTGAAEFDEAVVTALVAGTPGTEAAPTADVESLLRLSTQAPNAHADLTILEAGIRHVCGRGETLSALSVIFDEGVHEVRSLCGSGTLLQDGPMTA